MTNTPSLEQIRWLSADSDGFVWAEFGDDLVLYHRLSGKTHFLNLAARQVIEGIAAQPTSTADIAAEFDHLAAGDSPGSLLEDVGAMLLRFERLGLIQRA